MRTESRVSIIIPVYNAERTVGSAVRSVFAQSDPNWEAIVVDDGSTDRSFRALGEFNDSRLRCVRQQHEERSAARNRGLEEARGDLILFLDADDWLLPEAVAIHRLQAESHPECGVLVGDGYICRDDGSRIMKFSEQFLQDLSGADPISRLVLDRRTVGQNRTTVRRRLLQLHDIRFDPALTYAEDWLFWVRVAARTQIRFFDMPVAAYRWHTGNSTHQSSEEYRSEQVKKVRLGILRSEIFGSLPASTREAFLHQLLLENLAGRNAEQLEVCSTAQFTGLPDPVKVRLLRLVAADYLALKGDARRGKEWLNRAGIIPHRDLKLRLLQAITTVSPQVSRLILRLRRSLQPGQRDRAEQVALLPVGPQAGKPVRRESPTPHK